ncbi:hypothetical protein O181_005865 [Austropuccinia psidii MF-1]|uniref:Uncharacterized protein n=1 Tax=Austropuccinia psidii MF-1 TaxID=1389203 RepID=A0A9Q3GG97_9BASI|nr:hypothetical protein [Austropuccinia psidii MF-1]
MLNWQIAIQEYRGNITIISKERESYTNLDVLTRWPPDNLKNNQSYDPDVEVKIPIHFMEIDRKRKLRFSELALGGSTPDTYYIRPKETEKPILGIISSELHNELVN